MKPRRLSEIAAAVGGAVTGEDVEVAGVAADSRAVRSGDLFVALRGERTDGHDHIEAAEGQGAVAALVSRPVDGVPHVLVDDTGAALLDLARDERGRIAARIVGITGSTGKTSVKDLTAAVLGARFRVFASPRSFNTEIGVPLTLLGAPEDSEAVVIEMGSRGRGHIATLCEVARPEIGVVTGVGPAHLEMFGSVEAVADAKAELVEALPAEGTAVLNADDHRVRAMEARTRASVISFGLAEDADVRAEDLVLDPSGRPAFTLRLPSGTERVELPFPGEHMAVNACAAAAVGAAMGMSAAECAAGLKEARLSPWRMELIEGAGGIRILNDAYNANPTSMAAALRSARWIAQGGRCVAVLGEMAELGAASAEEHERIGELVARLGVERLIVVGEAARPIRAGAVREGVDAADVEECATAEDAIKALRALLRDGDVVLVKGSRVAGLERVAEALR